ncbi:hypothetical protein BBH88_04410 [Planococcus antarcticus DSM 14505]|uniref:Cxxc_20_cxxc protein n=1 Tax=Planococcus antarcticus DSM 14505 TaxID=1185653 RepID=A0ABM6D2H2_9BACL|nr:TIGR04104 family putative zinc finger protein [Planococcus antarcticus]ANU09595.1 hypothetical protein BBH88_04410 [Planococcus antarcticus DSM 14505]
MPSCENCGQKWKWKTIVLKTLKLTNKVNCPYCGKTQYIVPKSRKITGIYSFLPLFVIILSNLIFELEVRDVILLTATLLIVALGLYPFLMKLSNEDKIVQP